MPSGRTLGSMSSTLATATVLVVDDEPMVREVVARYLELDGIHVHEAADGAAALGLAGRPPPRPRRARRHAAGRRRAQHPAPPARGRRRPGDPAHRPGRGGRSRPRARARRRRLRRQAVLPARARRPGAHRAAPRAGPPAPAAGGHARSTSAAAHRPADPRGHRRRPARSSSRRRSSTCCRVLARSPRQVFSRRQLLDQVWDSAPEYQDPATVTVHVGRLRQKLERDPDDPAGSRRRGASATGSSRDRGRRGSWRTRSPTSPLEAVARACRPGGRHGRRRRCVLRR